MRSSCFFFSDLFRVDPGDPKKWVVKGIVRKVHNNYPDLPILASYEVMPEDCEDPVVDLIRAAEDEFYPSAADAYDSAIEELNRDIEAHRICLDHLLKRKAILEEERDESKGSQEAR